MGDLLYPSTSGHPPEQRGFAQVTAGGVGCVWNEVGSDLIFFQVDSVPVSCSGFCWLLWFSLLFFFFPVLAQPCNGLSFPSVTGASLCLLTTPGASQARSVVTVPDSPLGSGLGSVLTLCLSRRISLPRAPSTFKDFLKLTHSWIDILEVWCLCPG